jgi:hypothetical protein
MNELTETHRTQIETLERAKEMNKKNKDRDILDIEEGLALIAENEANLKTMSDDTETLAMKLQTKESQYRKLEKL